jgi:hypothetical protein
MKSGLCNNKTATNLLSLGTSAVWICYISVLANWDYLCLLIHYFLIQALPDLASFFTRPVETTTSDCLVRSLDLFHKIYSFIYFLPIFGLLTKKVSIFRQSSSLFVFVCDLYVCVCVCVCVCSRVFMYVGIYLCVFMKFWYLAISKICRCVFILVNTEKKIPRNVYWTYTCVVSVLIWSAGQWIFMAMKTVNNKILRKELWPLFFWINFFNASPFRDNWLSYCGISRFIS